MGAPLVCLGASFTSDDLLVVDRHCILTEGVMRIAFPGWTLVARGLDVDDPDALYLYESKAAIMWPFNDAGCCWARIPTSRTMVSPASPTSSYRVTTSSIG